MHLADAFRFAFDRRASAGIAIRILDQQLYVAVLDRPLDVVVIDRQDDASRGPLGRIRMIGIFSVERSRL